MANTFKNAALANVNHSAYSTLYTAPSATQVVILGLAIANKASTAVTVKVQFTDSSASTTHQLLDLRKFQFLWTCTGKKKCPIS